MKNYPALHKILVILAAYNGELWIKEQLQCIVNQSNVDLSILVSIDKSQDGTKQIVDSFKTRHSCISSTYHTERYGSAASNFLCTLKTIDISKYSYIAFADQDDIWMQDKIYNAITKLESSKAGGYSSDLITFDNRKHHSFYLKKSNLFKKYDYLFQGASAGCTYVLNQNAALLVQEKIKDLTTDYLRPKSHDWLIYAICRSYKIEWFHDLNSYILYRQHGNNVVGALPGIKGLIHKLKMSKSGWFREQVIQLKDVISAQDDEIKIISALERFNLSDRIWLIKNSYSYRRTTRDSVFLSILILFRLI